METEFRLYTFKEAPEIIEKLDDMATDRGSSRAALIREAIRSMLSDQSYLPIKYKKAFGIPVEEIR